ncbi:DNase I-like protein, partial [Punctularia strigosozonata HHB-11173 SS5]|uniref:DNase I-like protein n=1 Tax=Punctularia strigosozonata (strain HHB-11173) TaxID=741275 RepID=UPI0004416EB7
MYGKRLWIQNSPDPDRASNSAGVAFVLNRDLVSTANCEVKVIEEGRATALTLRWHDRDTVTIVNTYAPNEPGRHAAFWNKIKDARRQNKIPKVDILLGDFNVVEDDVDRAPPRKELESAVMALRECRQALNVHDAWREEYPSSRNYTYISKATGSMSRLDRMYIADDRRKDVYEWCCQTASLKSDHRIVWMKYAPTAMPYNGSGRWTWPLGFVNEWHAIAAIEARGLRLQNDLENLSHEQRSPEKNAQTLWKAFKEDMITTGMLITGAIMSRSRRKIATWETILQSEMEKEGIDRVNDEEPRRNVAMLEE